MEIGNKIRELRIGKGFTQEELAMLTGFSKSYIQKFEENRREINTSQLVKLANALNVSVSEILCLEKRATCITLMSFKNLLL